MKKTKKKKCNNKEESNATDIPGKRIQGNMAQVEEAWILWSLAQAPKVATIISD